MWVAVTVWCDRFRRIRHQRCVRYVGLVDQVSLQGRVSPALLPDSSTMLALTDVCRRRPDGGFGHPDEMSVVE